MGIIYQPPWRDFPGLEEEDERRLRRNFDEVTRQFSLSVNVTNFDCVVDSNLSHNNVAAREFRTVWEAVDAMSDLGYTKRVNIHVLGGAGANYANVVETQPGPTKKCDNIVVSGLGTSDVSVFRPIAPTIYWSWMVDTVMWNTTHLYILNMNVYLPDEPSQIFATQLQFENCLIFDFNNAFRSQTVTIYRCGIEFNLDFLNFYAYDSWIAPNVTGGFQDAVLGDDSRATFFVAHNCIFSGLNNGIEYKFKYTGCWITGCEIDSSWGLHL